MKKNTITFILVFASIFSTFLLPAQDTLKQVSTAAKNVQVLSENFNIPQLNRTRRIWLYLPPDYATSGKRYPVMYMQDGQNLFDANTSFAGEWEVDETLNKLHAEGDYGAIVIGIDNGSAKRLDEYAPWKNQQYGGGEGDAYIDFIVQTLKPYIDSNYRTLTQPACTCLFGSSLGALIALYGAEKYPTVFGKVGAFSPAYWFSINNLQDYIMTNTADIIDLRIAHVAGQNESATMVASLQAITNSLLAKGLKPMNSTIKIDPAGTHSEIFWRKNFGETYQWLFTNCTNPVR